VQSLDDAVRWFQGTFLFCCMSYRGHPNAVSTAQNMCNDALSQLYELGLVQRSGDIIKAQPGCHIMNKHLLSLDSMKAITSWPTDATQCQILRSLSLAKALHNSVKRNEKKELREIHKTDVIKFKISKSLGKFTVQDESQKAFILLQAIISQHEFQNKTLKQEMSSITNAATKILHAAHEYCIKSSKCGSIARYCFLLHRSLMVCLWGVDSGVLNQIDGVGLTCVRMLRIHGIHSFQHVLDSTEEQIERAAGRRFPFGKELKITVKDLMRDNLKLSAEIEYTRNSCRPASLVISLKDPSDPSSPNSARKSDPTVSFTIIAYTDSQNESILLVEEGLSKPTSFRVPLPSRFGKINVSKLASIVGFDESLTLDRSQHLLVHDSSRTEVEWGAIDPQAIMATNEKRVRKTRRLEMSVSPCKNPKITPSTSDHMQLDPSPTITPNRNDALYLTEKMAIIRGRELEPSQADNPSCDGVVSTNQNHESSPFAAAFWHLRYAAPRSPMKVTPTTYARRTQTSQSASHCDREYSSFASALNGAEHINSTDNQGVSSFWDTAMHNTNTHSLFAETSSEVVGNQWDKTLRRTSQSQKRAFTGKKENPFSTFSHDPNDSEGRLKNLSYHQRQFSSKQFKRMKDPRLERRAPSVKDRDLMKGYADELEKDRQRNLALHHDRRHSLSQNDFGYRPPLDHRIPPPWGPSVKYLRSGYNALESNNGYRQVPRHYAWNPPKIPEHEAQFRRPGRNYGRNFPHSDPFMDPVEIYEPFDSLQASTQPASTREDLYPGHIERQQQDRWAFREEHTTPTVPPSEIEFQNSLRRPDGFVNNDHDNLSMGPTTKHFYGSSSSFNNIFF
jgi:hypothetical protein